MKQYFKVLPAILLPVMLLAGCAGFQKDAAGSEPDNETGKLKVVTTLFPYYDFVRQVAGDYVELTMVIPAGMDSHSFEPTPADILTIQNADILVCNGGEMEYWLRQALQAAENPDTTIVTMMDYVDTVEEEIIDGMQEAHDHRHEELDVPEQDQTEDDGHELHIEYDEHIWTSPVNSMKLVRAIEAALSAADPEHAVIYQANASRYLDELSALDDRLTEVMNGRKRNMIVVGDKFPFRYLADQYDLEYRAAFSGCSTDTESSAQTIAYLIDKIRNDRIPVIYYLELSSRRVSGIIAEETGAVPLLLHSCHNVTRREFDDGITYLKLMEQNVENLRKGLDE